MYQRSLNLASYESDQSGPYLLGDTDGQVRQLGSITSIIGGLIGGVVGGPGGAAAGTSIGNLVSFTGSQDQQRQQRVNWMLTAAQQGSPLAAAIIVAGPANTASHEAPMWQQALAAVPSSVLAQANAQYPGGFWPVGAPFDMPVQRGQIVQQLAALGAAAPGTPIAGSVTPLPPAPSSLPTSPTGPIGTIPRPVMLPGMTTTAGYNWIPVAIVGGVALLALGGNRSRGSRGRR